MQTCHLCGSRVAAFYTVREMMHGTRDRFTYGECEGCWSLQLIDVPDDLAPYYPPNYYSFSSSGESLQRRFAKRLRAEALVRKRVHIAKFIGRGAPFPAWVDWMRITGLTRSSSICDVGCGGGDLLQTLRDQGFRHLDGIDAFLTQSTVRNGIPIKKGSPDELEGEYDLIMLNHSFEHIPDPIRTLKTLARRLTPHGFIMVRVPVAASPVWDQFGTDWVSIDAPRHLFIPSHAGMAAAVDRAGMILVDTLHETNPAEFWRSEQYRQDIPLFDDRAYEIDPARAGFTREEISSWTQQATELDRSGQSASAAFFLRASA